MKKLPLRVKLLRIGEPLLAEYSIAQTSLDSPGTVANFWHSVISLQPDHEQDKENLVSILVNTKLKPIGWNRIAIGSLNECTAHPREIFSAAIAGGAYAIVLLHNHPSGDPSPSEADRRLTRRLHEASEILQINLLDHVVIGATVQGQPTKFSFREAGLL